MISTPHPTALLIFHTEIPRYYASTTQGDTPTASNVSNPQSGSTQESDVKTSRAGDSTPNKYSASVQSPISQGNIQSEGVETPYNDEMRQNPHKPTSEKKDQVESLGKRPMGPEDHQ
jgi:hypothetical protein